MSTVQTPMPRGGTPWTPAQDALIMQLREQRQTYTVVSQHVGKTPLACRLRMNALNKARLRASQRAGMTGASGGSAQPAVSSNDSGSVVSDPAGSVTENARRASEAQENNSVVEEKVEAKEESAEEGCGEDSDQVRSGCV